MEQIKYKGEKRAKRFLELYKYDELTYEQIGRIYGFSKQLVYLELHKYFPNEIKQIIKKRGWHIGSRKEKRDFPEFTCKYCGKNAKSKYRYYTQKFCSPECHSKFMKKMYA